jgi:hypothetical protein
MPITKYIFMNAGFIVLAIPHERFLALIEKKHNVALVLTGFFILS